MPGHWEQVNSNTLSFRPAGLGLGLGGTVQVSVPGQDARLARRPRLDAAAAGAPRPARLSPGPLASARRLAFDADRAKWPPRSRRRTGRSPGAIAGTPASLQTLWKPGAWNVVTQGAVMRFENVHGMGTDGVAGPQVWRALMKDDLAGRRSDAGYNYVFVHETDAAVAQPLARRPRDPHLARQHRHRVGADRAGDVARLRAHLGRDDERHQSRRLALPRSRDPLDQLLPRRRRAPRVPARLVRDAAEPRLRRAAGGRRRAVWPYTPIGTLVTIES